jgi:hypothetical protein
MTSQINLGKCQIVLPTSKEVLVQHQCYSKIKHLKHVDKNIKKYLTSIKIIVEKNINQVDKIKDNLKQNLSIGGTGFYFF